MNEKLRKKIDFLTDITCYDHHKDKDMLYSIECEYRAYDKIRYYPCHLGYIWEFPEYEEAPKKYFTYEEAEKKLEEVVDEKIKEELEWLWGYLNNKDIYDVYGAPVKTEEDWIKLRDEYYAIK